MEKLNSKKISLTEAHNITGYGCSTTWTSSSGTGKDSYFDDNDNGKLDKGDTIFFDDGRVGTMGQPMIA
ncbi:hypothetical protein H2O64_08315 [Kordia sp. YSTF-M3]|uniref:Uncharacterized protein n=1 Tax=Kordia aestuariivivens TaxID=2759037 RepID=A0ABR7Q7Y6_9FLAO|nr:hypothetical protein [Kordia aestuariivivens]MBC8754676.1 hypothetical protein [Kordia aestuariivivens]